jgi:hypothetical protein
MTKQADAASRLMIARAGTVNDALFTGRTSINTDQAGIDVIAKVGQMLELHRPQPPDTAPVLN